jgi:hypothetical protein
VVIELSELTSTVNIGIAREKTTEYEKFTSGPSPLDGPVPDRSGHPEKQNNVQDAFNHEQRCEQQSERGDATPNTGCMIAYAPTHT